MCGETGGILQRHSTGPLALGGAAADMYILRSVPIAVLFQMHSAVSPHLNSWKMSRTLYCVFVVCLCPAGIYFIMCIYYIYNSPWLCDPHMMMNGYKEINYSHNLSMKKCGCVCRFLTLSTCILIGPMGHGQGSWPMGHGPWAMV